MKTKDLIKITKTGDNSYKIQFDPLFMVKASRKPSIPASKVFKSKRDYCRHPKHKKRWLEDYDL